MNRRLHSRFSPWSIKSMKSSYKSEHAEKQSQILLDTRTFCLAFTVQVGPSETVTCLPDVSLKSCDLLLDFFGLCMQPELCKLYTVVCVLEWGNQFHFDSMHYFLTSQDCNVFILNRPLFTACCSFTIKKRDVSNKNENCHLLTLEWMTNGFGVTCFFLSCCSIGLHLWLQISPYVAISNQRIVWTLWVSCSQMSLMPTSLCLSLTPPWCFQLEKLWKKWQTLASWAQHPPCPAHCLGKMHLCKWATSPWPTWMNNIPLNLFCLLVKLHSDMCFCPTNR